MKKINLAILGMVLALPAYGVHADDTYLREEINNIKDDIVVIQRQLYREKNDTTVQPQSISNVQVRLGEYDQLIRDMNGKVENIEFRLNNLEKKMEMLNKDIDLRFEQLKRQAPTAPQTASAPKPLKTQNNAPLPSGTTAKGLYEAALTDLKNSKLADAETKFSQFLTAYPKDALAGNAQYWLGEVYYKQQNFAKAAVAFKEGYSKYPEGTKGPDCLLKLGLSMKALGKNEEACTAFVNLPAVFSKVAPDISARAKKEAEGLKCK